MAANVSSTLMVKLYERTFYEWMDIKVRRLQAPFGSSADVELFYAESHHEQKLKELAQSIYEVSDDISEIVALMMNDSFPARPTP